MKKKKKVRYTKKLHAYRLGKMLDSPRSLGISCPATLGFNITTHFQAHHQFYNSSREQVCGICRSFVLVRIDAGCPCLILGISKAVEASEKALKAFYAKEKKK